jgi:hypothetical protein
MAFMRSPWRGSLDTAPRPKAPEGGGLVRVDLRGAAAAGLQSGGPRSMKREAA